MDDRGETPSPGPQGPDQASGAPGVPPDLQLSPFWQSLNTEQQAALVAHMQGQIGEAVAEPNITLDDRVQVIAPDSDPISRESIKTSLHSLDDLFVSSETFGDTEKTAAFTILNNNHIKQEPAQALLRSYNIPEPLIDEITKNLEKEADGIRNDVSDGDQSEMIATGLAMQNQLGGAEGELDAQLGELAKVDPTTLNPEELEAHREDHAQLLAKKGRIASISQRITDLFAPDTKGRKAAGITWKVVYYSVITAFVLLILEMNLISKVAGNKRR